MRIGIPDVSVIVTCYDRREFLLSALESLTTQDAPVGSFEVIVVKNFMDDEIDMFCKDHGYKAVHTQTTSQGGLAAEGVLHSTGRVLSFLDDDDKFSSSKVAAVKDIFSDEEVIFYHNAHCLIDAQGIPKPGNKLKPPKKEIRFRVNHDTDLRKVLRENGLYHLGTLFFNLSSISVIRDVALEHMSDLQEMKSRPDDFIFFASLKRNNGIIVIGPDVLTLYREHQSASNPERTRQTLIDLKHRHISGSEIIVRMLEGSPFESMARSQLGITQTDLYRLRHDLKSYLRNSYAYFKSQRMNNFPFLYTALNYVLGLFETGNNELFRRIRSIFLSIVGDIRSED